MIKWGRQAHVWLRLSCSDSTAVVSAGVSVCVHLWKCACHPELCINLRFVVLQEHHEEDLFLYMTYSNESVYGAWGRTKDWRKRETGERERERLPEELRAKAVCNAPLLFFILVLISNYSTGWKKDFAQGRGLWEVYFCQYFGVSIIHL